MSASYNSFMDDDQCLNDDDAIVTYDDEVDGEETGQGNSWFMIDDDDGL